jgi:hypothetical protein
MITTLALLAGASAVRDWTVGNATFTGMLDEKEVRTGLCDPDVKQLSGYFKVGFVIKKKLSFYHD